MGYSTTKPLILVFSLEQLNLEAMEFFRLVEPHFENLSWDNYDVRAARTEILTSFFGNDKQLLTILPHYYSGSVNEEKLKPWIRQLPRHQQLEYQATRPFRRRAFASFSLDRANSGWKAKISNDTTYCQQVGDIRSRTRIFDSMSPEITLDPLFLKFIESVAQLVGEWNEKFQRMKIDVHQVRTVARPGMPGSNSPESIHQDGADYVVSALVVSRKAIEGGVSRVFLGPEGEAELMRIQLSPGQGILHADAGSPLWHDVTRIHLDPRDKNLVGFRDSIGLDINFPK